MVLWIIKRHFCVRFAFESCVQEDVKEADKSGVNEMDGVHVLWWGRGITVVLLLFQEIQSMTKSKFSPVAF